MASAQAGISLIIAGAVLPLIWGIAHLFPTGSVVRGFGEIGEDDRQIIRMEWIVEGTALIFTGIVNVLVTVIDPTSSVSRVVYATSAVFLLTMAAVSLFTGFRVDFTPFKLCPVVFISSAVLIISGSMMA